MPSEIVSDLAMEYIYANYGRIKDAIKQFADDLMRGDPETFKAGYTLPNAVIATAEAFCISREETEKIIVNG